MLNHFFLQPLSQLCKLGEVKLLKHVIRIYSEEKQIQILESLFLLVFKKHSQNGFPDFVLVFHGSVNLDCDIMYKNTIDTIDDQNVNCTW